MLPVVLRSGILLANSREDSSRIILLLRHSTAASVVSINSTIVSVIFLFFFEGNLNRSLLVFVSDLGRIILIVNSGIMLFSSRMSLVVAVIYFV